MWMTVQSRAHAHAVSGKEGPKQGLTKDSNEAAEALADGSHI